MEKIIREASWKCQENGSNKEYHFQMIEENGSYVINFQYGAIGKALKDGTKTATPVSLEKANKQFDSMVKERLSKGYVGGESSGDKAFNEVESKDVKSKKGGLTESQLWKLIESAQWSKFHDYDKASKIFRALPKEDFNQLEQFYQTKVSELANKYEKDWLGDPGIGVSDDGWSDLTAEVVGRGKKFYDGITVKKLQKMADTNDYTENFGYSFQNN